MATPQVKHPTDAQLTDFSSGKLAQAESGEIEQHLAECDTCCQLLKTLPDDTLVALLRQEQPETPGDVSQDLELRVAATIPPESARPTAPPGVPLTMVAESDRAAADEVPAGLRDHPRYRIVALLGRGGMGSVYQAEHRLMKRSVALKVINPQLLQNSVAVERFQREVQAAAKLAHPNIVAAYDAEQAADTHFLVMEYVPGEDLSALVEKQGRLPISTACDYVRQAALGLEQARERGMVHRDIKPQNLILTSGGQVKILDFGLAQFASEIAEQSGLTQAGAVMGTPDYMAPEQARDAHSADIRADIYSLGCTLYCLLTGRPPFNESTTVGKIMAHIEREPTPVTELCVGLPPELQSVLRKMMAKDPADRHQTPAEVAAALAPFTPSSSESTRAILPTSSPAVSGRRLPFTPLAIAVLVGLAFLGVFGGMILVVTDKGQIEIQSEVDDVDVVVTQGGKEITIFDRQTGSQVKWLPSGTYDVQLKGNRNDLELSSHGFALSRWGKQVVTLKRKTNAATAEKSAAQDFPRIAIRPTGPVPPLAVAPFDATKAKEHQAAWAKHLGVPVEMTNSIGMKMVLIPPGEFDMGSTEVEVAKLLEQANATNQPSWYIDHARSEAPKHRVRITKPFWLGVHEVTRGQFRRFVDDRGYQTEAERDGKGGYGLVDGQWKQDPRFVWNRDLEFEQADDHPVVNVTWNDVTAFCTWLSEKEGEKSHLPSEAQWEYACRAGTTNWYSGDDEAALKEYGWFNFNASGKRHPVGQKWPNAWGLYDMHGNVWEWCQDWFEERYYATSPMDDPPGASGGLYRVGRGGSWRDGASCGRASYRGWNVPGDRGVYVGYRLAMAIPFPGSGAASSQPSGAGVSSGSPQSPNRPIVKPSEPAACQPPDMAAITPTGPVPPLAVAPFDAKQAKSHQAAWAKHLGLPIEFENSLGMRFVLIPPGEFDMGSTEAEVAKLLEKAIATKQEDWYIERLPTEAPKHRVRITKPMYLGLFEVTQAEYERVVGTNPSHFQGEPTCPVEMVNWDEASAFCRKLGDLPQEQASRAEYRLPTEAEWEYACRAGTTTAWYLGDDEAVLKEHAWYNPNAGGQTHPVGRKSPNAWGLYDMHGNVWEWCQDWSGDRYYAMSPMNDPTGTSEGSDRVFRGGSCLNNAFDGRASVRGMNGPGYRNLARGFRLVMVIPSPGSGAVGVLRPPNVAAVRAFRQRASGS